MTEDSDDDDDDDDDDVVIGSSASLSRFRDNQPNKSQSKRNSRSRDPTIYRDPDKQSEWYQNKNSVRSHASMSEYLGENEVENERRRKVDAIRHKQKEGEKRFLDCIFVISNPRQMAEKQHKAVLQVFFYQYKNCAVMYIKNEQPISNCLRAFLSFFKQLS